MVGSKSCVTYSQFGLLMKHGCSNTLPSPALRTIQSQQTKPNPLVHLSLYLQEADLPAHPDLQQHQQVPLQCASWFFCNMFQQCSGFTTAVVCFLNGYNGKGRNTVNSSLSNRTTHQVTKDSNPGYARPRGARVLPRRYSCWMQLSVRIIKTLVCKLFAKNYRCKVWQSDKVCTSLIIFTPQVLFSSQDNPGRWERKCWWW